MSPVEFRIVSGGFDPLMLGMTRAEIDAALGETAKPDGEGHPGEPAFVYEAASARVVLREGRAVELALWPPAQATFGGRSLFGNPDVWREIVEADGDAHETFGFLVLRNLGLTLTGFHDDDPGQLAVTAFEPGRWDAVASGMKPFRL